MGRAALRVPAPKMAVCDGSPGFAAAAAAVWLETRIQRCTFHVAAQVRCTTLRPRLEAESNLWASPTSLLRWADADGATAWLLEYNAWCVKWEPFLREYTFKEGRRVYAHERLRKARRILEQARQGHAVHRGDGTRARRRMALHQQRRRASTRDFEIRSGITEGFLAPPRQGDLCGVMHTESPLPAAEILRHANRRRCGRAVRRSVERIEARGTALRRARNGDVWGGVPYAHEIQAVNNPEGHF